MAFCATTMVSGAEEPGLGDSSQLHLNGVDGPSQCVQDIVLAPLVFTMGACLLAARARDVLWGAVASSSAPSWRSASLLENFQTILVVLMASHSAFALISASQDDSARSQVLYSSLQLVLWVTCAALTVLEIRRGVARGPQLKVFWTVDFLTRILRVRLAILDLSSPISSLTISSRTQSVLEVLGFSISLSLVISGFFHTAAKQPGQAETTYTTMKEDEIGSKEKTAAQASRSWASCASFSWMTRLFILANSSDAVLKLEDMLPPRPDEMSHHLFPKLLAAWRHELRQHASKPQLLRAIAAVATVDMLYVCLVNASALSFTILGPLLFQAVMHRLESGTLQLEDGGPARVDAVMLAFGIGACKASAAVLNAQVHSNSLRIGGMIRSALIAMIYRKALLLSAEGRQKFEIGSLISLVSVDANRVCHCVFALQNVFGGLLQIAIGTALLLVLLGPSVLVGLLFLAAFSPINVVVARSQSRINHRIMKLKDQRSNLMDEILQGIRIIKYFAWERSFEAKILEMRKEELAQVRNFGLYNIVSMCIWGSSAMILAVVTFGVYTWDGRTLTPSVAFSALVLFNVMNGPLSTIGNLIEQVVQTRTALVRLQAFFVAEELDRRYYQNCVEASEDELPLPRATCDTCPLQMSSATFSWPKCVAEEEEDGILSTKDSFLDSFRGAVSRRSKESVSSSFRTRGQPAARHSDMKRPVEFVTALKHITLQVDIGELCIVTGKVGSGKSSLLSAVLGEMRKESGSITLSGKVAYAGQQPWIFNGTLRDNILLGAPFDAQRYDQVLQVCCLERDLETLLAGDMTEIGEKGINMSGGQKARVALARAAYQDADVYLLDDPLAAVDAHVRERLFRDCIQDFLRDKTRLLTTHHLRYLPSAHRVLVLDAGTVAAIGSPQEVLAGCPQLVDMASHPSENDDDDVDDEDGDEEDAGKDSKQASANGNSGGKERKGKGKLMSKEGMEREAVSADVWKRYVEAVGYGLVGLFFFILCGVQALEVGRGWWLAAWSGSELGEAHIEFDRNATRQRSEATKYSGGDEGLEVEEEDGGFQGWYLGVYAGLALVQCVGIAVLRAPVCLFDTTPTGRILNRFAGDMQGIDREMQLGLLNLLKLAVKAVLVGVTVAVTAPWMLLVGVPTMACCVWVQRTFQKGCVQIRRLLAHTRSPMFAHFTETLNGLETIRAFGQHTVILERGCHLADNWIRAMFGLVGAMNWLKVRIECLGSMVVSATAVAAVMAADGVGSAATAGLSISLALELADTTRELLQQMVNMETNLVAAERVTEYGNLPSEPADIIPDARPSKEWPHKGKLVFENVVMAYREGLEPALRDLSFEINGAEKIGLVGRTGAGKSSVAVCLFRMAQLVSGKVSIDGVDISTIGVSDLRMKLSIIPQDPVLFSGTIRSNLDPFGSFSDDEVWEALQQVRMDETIRALPGALGDAVATGGGNLSVGERQLLCLARALLRQSKVIVMDEATASVDLQTDELIQSAIKECFAQSTVLTIAHRLDTVMKCDRIMVLNQGKVLEMGTPASLVSDTASAFHSMVNNPHAAKQMLG